MPGRGAGEGLVKGVISGLVGLLHLQKSLQEGFP